VSISGDAGKYHTYLHLHTSKRSPAVTRREQGERIQPIISRDESCETTAAGDNKRYSYYNDEN